MKSGNAKPPPGGGFTHLIVSNTLLALATAGILFLAVHRFRGQADAVTLRDSRFFTTEWRLLLEMKEQADRKLLDKDREIAVLNELYLRLVQDNASNSELRQIRTMLGQAETERREIVAERILENQGASAREDPLFQELFLPAEDSERLRILSERGESLEARLLAARREAEGGLRELEGLPLLGVGELNAKALTRALLGSPQIRSEYPDLLESLDRFLAGYGSLERAQGRREAYTAILRSLAPGE